MARLLRPVIALALLIDFASTGNAQDVATWKGSVVTAPAKQVPAGNGMVELVEEASTTIQLSLQKDRTWDITYNLDNSQGENGSSNASHQPLSLLLKIDLPDSAVNIYGTISPDSSTINCTVLKGKSKTDLVLHRAPLPVSWSGDTTINKNRTAIMLTYSYDPQWEITVSDSAGSATFNQANEPDSNNVSFHLYSSFDVNSRRIEGTMSPDSSTISCTLFINDSIKIPIVLYKGKKNIEDYQRRPYLASSRFWWRPLAAGWAIILIILLLFFGFRKKSASISGNASIVPTDADWLTKILPIVRISCQRIFRNKRKVLILYSDSLVLFCTNKKTNIDGLHDEDSHALINTVHGLKNIKHIPLASIEKIEVEKESRLGKVRCHIYYNDKKETFVLPGYEMPNLLKALQSLAGNRLQIGYLIRFHAYGIWIQLLVFSLAASYIYNLISSGSGFFWIILYIILFILVLLRIVFLLFSVTPWFLDHLPRKFKVDNSAKSKADLSHRKPFRSVPIAILLKIIGAFIFIITFLILKQQYLPASLHTWILRLGLLPFLGLFGVCGYLLVGFILNLSLSFANRNPKAADPGDIRKPILYLRSFLDDRETTLQPGTWLSNFLGVDPPYYQLSKYMFNPTSLSYRFNKLMLKYLYNNHPIRMLRLMLGWPVDTSEQQLELYFRKKGPFVAIGRPGERIITSGANRMYVTNEEWQNVILDYLHTSQLVVLQPSSTEGIWWEINQSLNIVEPHNLFLCMVNYKGHQNFYEDFRLRIEDLKKEIRLQRFLGNAKEICFFRFDDKWKPELLRQHYKSFLYWPFQGNAADLKRSLEV